MPGPFVLSHLQMLSKKCLSNAGILMISGEPLELV